MKPWLNDGFSESLWERDIALLQEQHRALAREVFQYSVVTLGSEPFQRESSRKNRSDGQTIFRTKLHRSFWLVLDTRTGGLQLIFPDKEDAVRDTGGFVVERCSDTQWTRKKEKRTKIPLTFGKKQAADLLTLVDAIHTGAVEYYSRGKDFSLTLQTLLGYPRGGVALAVPDTRTFAALLSGSPACKICGTSKNLSLHSQVDRWELYCDSHHPTPSKWAALGQEAIPFDVKRAVWHRDGGLCVACGSANFATFDHLIPANRGGGAFTGSHLETNIRLKCRTCNFSKGNKLIP